MSSQYVNLGTGGNPTWQTPVVNAAALPLVGNQLGDARVAEDTGFVYGWNGTSWNLPGAGGGTVTSVSLVMPAGFSVSGSPVTGAGGFTVSLSNESANTVWAGPTSGGAATPAFRLLVAADIPNLSASKITSGQGTLSTSTTGVTVGTGTNVLLSNATVDVQTASGSQPGLLSAADWTTFNGKQNALTLGNFLAGGVDGLIAIGGTGAVIGAGVTLSQHVADATHNGYLSSADWNTFNGKQDALTFGNLTDAGTDGITVTNGTGSVIGTGTSLSQHVADATHNGYLSSADWVTFNGKQSSLVFADSLLNTAGTVTLVGDSASPTASQYYGTNAGSVLGFYNLPAGTGTVTSVSVVTANGFAGTVATATSTPAITLTTTITGLLKGNGTAISAAVSGTDYQPAGNYITALTGDVVAAGPGSAAATIQNNVVSNAKLAQMPTLTIKGNNTGGTANALDLTVAQVNAILPVFTSTLNGLVPASGGGTTNFLRADGTFAVPPGTGTVTSVALTVPSFLSVAGSPITTSGTLAVTLTNETANFIFAGPTSGGAATPTFRAQVFADLPSLYNFSIITSNTTAVSGNSYFCDTSGGAFNLTLPTPTLNAAVRVKDSTGSFSVNNLTIVRHAAEKIEGVASSKVLNSPWSSVVFVADGTNWFML